LRSCFQIPKALRKFYHIRNCPIGHLLWGRAMLLSEKTSKLLLDCQIKGTVLLKPEPKVKLLKNVRESCFKTFSLHDSFRVTPRCHTKESILNLTKSVKILQTVASLWRLHILVVKSYDSVSLTCYM